ncbi:hypothetical protein N9A08_01520 [Arthrobacter koreensis]|uniref:Lipoprotein n=1 Tax=Arthrobacter koreensis TaxID=199136 RepID=A0ABY6FT47_9MICC|nr:hypothetical protein [Arthrobacter koreensis]UYB36396.1 hypothetical protein N9A08_01520 [Arthrobacter koreensis]
MGKQFAGAAAALMAGVLLAGCGPTDAEVNEAQALAAAKASPEPTPWEPRPCNSGEVLQTDAVSGMQSLRPDCLDQALVEAIEEFPEPLPPVLTGISAPSITLIRRKIRRVKYP